MSNKRFLNTSIKHRISDDGCLILPYDLSEVDCNSFLLNNLPYTVKIKTEFPAVKSTLVQDELNKIIQDSIEGVWYSNYHRTSDNNGELGYWFQYQRDALIFKLRIQ